MSTVAQTASTTYPAEIVPEPPPIVAAPGRRRPLRWVIRIMIAAVVIAAFVYLGRNYQDELPRLRQAKPLAVLLMVLVFIPTRLLTSEVMRLGLRALGHRVSVYESFMVSMVNAYANLLLPRAGLGLPALYMKLKHAIPIADFSMVQLLPMTVLQMTTIGLAGVGCLLALRLFQGQPIHVAAMGVFAGVAIASYVGTHFRIGIPERWQNRLALFLRRATESWQRLGRSGHTIGWSMLLHALVLVLRAVRLHLAFSAVGVEVNYLGVFAASLFADLAFFVSITPSALGFREGAIVLGAQMMGTTADLAVAAAILDRLVYSAVIVIIAQFGLFQLVRPVFKAAGEARAVAVQAPAA